MAFVGNRGSWHTGFHRKPPVGSLLLGCRGCFVNTQATVAHDKREGCAIVEGSVTIAACVVVRLLRVLELSVLDFVGEIMEEVQRQLLGDPVAFVCVCVRARVRARACVCVLLGGRWTDKYMGTQTYTFTRTHPPTMQVLQHGFEAIEQQVSCRRVVTLHDRSVLPMQLLIRLKVDLRQACLPFIRRLLSVEPI